MNTTSTMKKKVGEPHRIYWQQWIPASGGKNPSNDTTTDGGANPTEESGEHWSRKELILSSAAIRLSRSAKVKDVTELLRKTLQLPPLVEDDTTSIGSLQSYHQKDCLVLVGSIYSLPHDFVQYEHELQHPPRSSSTNIHEHSRIYPFHIVHSLTSTDKPLDAYDDMAKHLRRFCASIPSIIMQESQLPLSSPPLEPKIQWYYVPTVSSVNYVGSGTLLPNCVELDGYCTSMEDAEGENEDEEDSVSTASTVTAVVMDCDPYVEDLDQQRLSTAFPWLNADSDTSEVLPTSFAKDNAPLRNSVRSQPCYSIKAQQEIRRQERLYMEFCASESQTPAHCCLTGYLLYRDGRDPHVWRRMYCVLTNNELWYMSRIYTCFDSTDSSESVATSTDPLAYKLVRHGRIRLTRAILIQPTPVEPVLHRTPYAFELISSKGISHIFRTNNKQMQALWITTISERIILSYESSLLYNAELIMDEESHARNRRANALAVEPLWDETIRVMQELAQQSANTLTPSIGNSIGSVLRFGMDVALYKDRCRYVQSSMPTRTPVVVATPPRRRFFSRSEEKCSSTSDPIVYEPLDQYIQDMIHVTWDQAAALLSRARSLAITLQVRSSIKHDSDEASDVENVRIKLSHGLDTLCRHIEFILTGRLDHRKEYSSSDLLSANVSNPGLERHNEVDAGKVPSTTASRNAESPPPADLFDHLLHELQTLAANADRRVVHPVRDPNLIDH